MKNALLMEEGRILINESIQNKIWKEKYIEG